MIELFKEAKGDYVCSDLNHVIINNTLYIPRGAYSECYKITGLNRNEHICIMKVVGNYIICNTCHALRHIIIDKSNLNVIVLNDNNLNMVLSQIINVDGRLYYYEMNFDVTKTCNIYLLEGADFILKYKNIPQDIVLNVVGFNNVQYEYKPIHEINVNTIIETCGKSFKIANTVIDNQLVSL